MNRTLVTNEGYELRANYRRLMFHELESCDDFIEAFVARPDIYITLSHCYEMSMESDELDWDEGWEWAADQDKFVFDHLMKNHTIYHWECLWEVIVDAWAEWRSKIYEHHVDEMVEALACRILLDQYEMEYVDPVKMEALVKAATEDWAMDDWKQGIERLLFNGGESND